MSLSLGVSIAASLCFIAAVLWAAVADLVTMTIRNQLVLVLLAGYVVLAPLSGMGWADIGWSIAVAVGVLAGMFVLFGFGWIGGGDAKFAAVIALWLGADQALAYVLCTALFGGILTIFSPSISRKGLACPMPHRVMDHAPACTSDWCSLRCRDRGGSALHFPGNPLDESPDLRRDFAMTFIR